MGQHKIRNFLWVSLMLALLGAGGYYWWLYNRFFETTDNAYVHATTVPVSTRIAGVVQNVLVDDNQAVNKGDILIRLDPTMYRVAVERAEAEVAIVRAKLASSKISVAYATDRETPLVQEAQARLSRLRQTIRSAQALLLQKQNEAEAAAANLTRAREELERKQALHAQKVISNEVLEQAVTLHRVAVANRNAAVASQQVERQKMAALRQQIKEVKASIELVKTEKLSSKIKSMDSLSIEAELKEAIAKLKEARLRLSYTEIRAPISGHLNKKSVDVGSYLQPGRRLLVIVPLHKIYIQANFKEVQLGNLRVGQPVIITADAYPRRPFRGRVNSIYSGTGDAFSLLPAENATGNWVKVTRRIPVKIVLDKSPSQLYPLLIGMSVHVKVNIKNRSGSHLLPYPSRAQKNLTRKP